MKKVIYTIIILAIVGGVVWLVATPGKPGKLDTFAQCLTDKGAKFYGAFWCQHCQNQKALFGKSAKYLPYVECSTPDGQGQKEECRALGINAYPTWQFGEATTTRINGEASLNELASRTGCELPQ